MEKIEKYMKQALKNKVKITKAAIIAILITGGIAVPKIARADTPNEKAVDIFKDLKLTNKTDELQSLVDKEQIFKNKEGEDNLKPDLDKIVKIAKDLINYSKQAPKYIDDGTDKDGSNLQYKKNEIYKIQAKLLKYEKEREELNRQYEKDYIENVHSSEGLYIYSPQGGIYNYIEDLVYACNNVITQRLLDKHTYKNQMDRLAKIVDRNSEKAGAVNENYYQYYITNENEKHGLELGDNSQARGTGSIVTSENGIAFGKGAVATGGDNVSREDIERKLKENQEKLNEIENLKKTNITLTNQLSDLQQKEQDVIQAGIRVEQIRKARANAEKEAERLKNTWQTEVDDSKEFFKNYQAKIDDLNSRLTGVGKLKNNNIQTPDGLEKAITEFKHNVEDGTNLNLSRDFYKDYITSYYKALGDLRSNKEFYSNHTNVPYADFQTVLDKILPKVGYINLTTNRLKFVDKGYQLYLDEIWGYDSIYIDKDNYRDYVAKNNVIPYIYNPHLITINEDNYNIIMNNIKKIYNNVDKIIDKTRYNKLDFTDEDMKYIKQHIKYTVKDGILNIEERLKFAYYQWKYEQTHDVTWLDKKAKIVSDLKPYDKDDCDKTLKYLKDKNIVSSDRTFVDLDEIYLDRVNSKYDEWKKENITDVENKNRITTEKLTSELEKALGVNKNAIKERQEKLDRMKSEYEQADRNAKGLNPSEKDLILSKEYERVKTEIEQMTKTLKGNQEKLKALKEALTLYDLKNKGKDNIAYGTDTLAVGDNAIAFGKGTKTVGENSISYGVDLLTLGENNTNIGQLSQVNGEKNQVMGYGNEVKGDQNLVFGSENKVGTETKGVMNNILFGNKIDATSVNNAIVFGNESKAIEGAVSFGNDTTTRQLKFVAKGTDDTDAVNFSQLKDYVKKNAKGKNVNIKNELLSKLNYDPDTYLKIDETYLQYISGKKESPKIPAEKKLSLNIDGVKDALGKDSDITNPKDKFVTDTKVHDYVTTNFVSKNDLDVTKLLKSEDVNVTGDEYITVTPNKNKYALSLNKDKLGANINISNNNTITTINDELGKKANKDAGNLDENDVTKWQEKLGNGSVTEGDAKLVKGGTVFTYVNNIKQQLSTQASQDLAKKLNTDADNLSKTGVTNLTTKLGTGEIKDGDANLVTGGTVKAYITEEINNINNTVSGKLSSEDVDVKGDEYITVNNVLNKPNHYKLAFNKEQLATDLDLTNNAKLNEKFSKYALLDGSNLDSINLNVWQAKLGNGTITKDNTGLVKGGDIFTYVNNIKQELNNQATQDLSNKLDKDGSNLDKPTLDKLTNKLSEGSNLTTPTNRLVTDTTVSEALKDKLNVDADNLTKNGVTNLTNKLGTGVVKEGDTGLITGGKVYEVKKELTNNISTNTQNITELGNKYTTLNNQVTTNTKDISKLKTDVEDLKNTKQDITNINNKLGDIDNSITTINTKLDGKLDKADLSITGDKYIGVKKDNKFNYTLSFNKDTLANDLDLTNNNSINNMFTTKLGDINTNIGDLTTKVENNTNSINSLTTTVEGNTNKITNLTNKVDTNTKDIDTLKQDMTKKLNVDADNLTTKGETNLINKLSKGSDISKPNNKLVTDTQVNTFLNNKFKNFSTNIDNRVINTLQQGVNVVNNKADLALAKSDLALTGISNAVAMANLPQVASYGKYKHMLTAAYGNYAGVNALALGFSGTTDSRRITYKISGSVNTKGNLAFGTGIGVMLGEIHDGNVDTPSHVKEQLIKSEKERQLMRKTLINQQNKAKQQEDQIKDLYRIIGELQNQLKNNEKTKESIEKH